MQKNQIKNQDLYVQHIAQPAEYYLYTVRYFLEIAYKGTAYNGWQVQPNGITVQQTINTALSTLLRDPVVYCVGCGRTDAGVHAAQFYLHFITDATIPEQFVERMNAFLPVDISVKRMLEVHDTAHTRFDATSRSYEYRMSSVKDVFRYGMVYYKPFHKLDLEKMQAAAKILMQFDDFPSFCKSKAGSKTTIVKLQAAYWEERGTDLVFCISADRFLRGMVRLVVGAMLQIGESKMSLEEFEAGIREKRRFQRALSAPAHGLYLTSVIYPYINNQP
jgi:tRNA pseudouridine38-40 synthase